MEKVEINPQLLQRGQEIYQRLKVNSSIFSEKVMWFYYYRHKDGALFFSMATTLEECRSEKDKWVNEYENSED